MVDQIITRQDLIDAHVDAQALEDIVNDGPEIQVQTRLGRVVWTLATLEQRSLLKIQEWQNAIDSIVVDSGVPDSVVINENGETQEKINNQGGATWYEKSGGYALNDRVILDNGNVVRSTAPNNTNNPNVDLTGWVFVSKTLTTVELKLLKPTINTLYYIEDKAGFFEWVVGNYTSMMSLDVNEGIYIKATFIASNIGCWKRVFSGLPFAKWFGDMTNPTNIQNAINVCKYHKGIYFDDVSIAGTTSITLDGFNDFEIKAQDTVVTGSATKPFIIKNSVNFRAYGFKHEYTGFSSGFNATLFDVENSTNIQIFENQTNTSAISTPKNCKQVKIYKNTVDLGAMQNQGIQLQGCSNVYIYLNTIKNSLIDGIKIAGDVSSGVFIYNNYFENLGGFETQGDCVDCYNGGTNVVIYKNTAKNCRQLANIKKGDLSTGDAPTSKIYVGENICTDVGNLCQLWNVDHVSVMNNRLIHTTDFVPSSQISPSLIYVAYTTENIKIINNEFINVIAPTAVIHVSAGDAKKLDIVGNSVTGTATTAQYADIYITASDGNINIENNNISHAGTNLTVRVQPSPQQGNMSLILIKTISKTVFELTTCRLQVSLIFLKTQYLDRSKTCSFCSNNKCSDY